MHSWEYQAIDAAGAKVKGRLRAATEQDALAMVMDKQLSPLRVSMITPEAGLFNRIKSSDLEQITTELALLLRNGVQLDKALDMMSQANPNVTASEMLAQLTESVRSGHPLYVAFSNYPRYFDPLYCEMVRIGEETGQLALTLERLGHNQKFQNELMGKVNQAMVYPAFIFAVCLVALFAIFNFIVPSMEGLFANMRDLPAYTQFLIDSSAWLRQNQFGLFAVILGLGVIVVSSWRKSWFQDLRYSVLRRTPLMKTGLLLGERIRFISSMQLMLQSGLPLAQALGFTVNIVKDSLIKKQLQRIKDQVSQGKMLSDSLATTDILEPVMLSLVKVGEESGQLENVFKEMGERTRMRFEQWAMKLTSMLEPILIIVMGGLVGSVVVTMLLSIVSTSDVPI
jgi:general secretion pathway protein F